MISEVVPLYKKGQADISPPFFVFVCANMHVILLNWQSKKTLCDAYLIYAIDSR